MLRCPGRRYPEAVVHERPHLARHEPVQRRGPAPSCRHRSSSDAPAGQLLVEQGHQVVLHARNVARAEVARRALPQDEGVVEGDVTSVAGTRQVAEQANRLGRFDAVIHNVGGGYREPRRIETVDGLPHALAINVMAPCLLTSLMERPKRLVYLSFGMHHHVNAELDDALLAPARLGRFPRLCRKQAVRRGDGVRGKSPSARRHLRRARTRLGANPDGRPRRTRRSGPGASDPGVACDE